MASLIPDPIHTEVRSHAIHLKRLLVATDFSAAAAVGLSYAKLLARLFHSEITLVHAITSAGTDGADDKDERAEWNAASEQLNAERFKVEARGIRCSSVCRVGDPSDILVQTAAEKDSDLLILGSIGHHSLAPSQLGSTAAFIMRAAPCPTLMIGVEATRKNVHLSSFRRLIFASSLRDHMGQALSFAETVARVCNASVDVVHIRQKSDQILPSEVLEHRQKAIVAHLNRAGIPASSYLLDPPAGKSIAEIAEQRGAGLIIFGVEHKALDPSARSTISEVIQLSPCPVLTVPGVA